MLAEVAAGFLTVENRWDEKAGLRRDAIGSQVIDALEGSEIKETGHEEAWRRRDSIDRRSCTAPGYTMPTAWESPREIQL